jgi:hypothetical protein
MHIQIDSERWPQAPVRISGYNFTESDVILVTVTADGISGRAAGGPVRGGNDPPDP